MELVDAKQIGDLLSIKPSTVVGSLSKKTGFPKPIKSPGIRCHMWSAADIHQWLGFQIEFGPRVTKVKDKRLPTIRQALAKKLAGAQRRSRAKGRPCPITLKQLLALHEQQGNRCAVSGIEFVVSEGEDGPFAPTIDRIKSDLGYEPGNIRLVCLSINLMMNKWGDYVYADLAVHIRNESAISKSPKDYSRTPT